MTLAPAIGRNRYCGPAALAIVANLDTDTAAATFRQLTGKRAVYGLNDDAMAAALRTQVVVDADVTVTHPVPLDHFACDPGVYVVSLSRHYVVLDTRDAEPLVCDNHTIYPRPLAGYRFRRSRVRRAWRVSRCDQPALPWM